MFPPTAPSESPTSLNWQGAKSVEKSRGQLARTQEKRKRAEEKAAQQPQKKCAALTCRSRAIHVVSAIA